VVLTAAEWDWIPVGFHTSGIPPTRFHTLGFMLNTAVSPTLIQPRQIRNSRRLSVKIVGNSLNIVQNCATLSQD
jgi:hypothetical protein